MLATPKYKIQTIREFKTFVVISLNSGRKMQNRGSYSLSFSTRSTVSKPIYIETGLKHQCLVILSDTRRVLFVCKSNSNVYLWSKCCYMLEFEFSLPVPMTTFQTDVRGVASQVRFTRFMYCLAMLWCCYFLNWLFIIRYYCQYFQTLVLLRCAGLSWSDNLSDKEWTGLCCLLARCK